MPTSYSSLWGIPSLQDPIINAQTNVFGSELNGFDPQYLRQAANYAIFNGTTFTRIPSQEEYEKVFQTFKEDPSQYYKSAIESAASTLGHNTSLYDYFGGQIDPVAYKEAPQEAYTKIATQAIQNGYLTPDQIKSISNPAYEAAYTKQSGYNNPDLRGGSSFFDKTLGAITSNPLTTLAFPIVGAAALGAFAAPTVAGTDYLGSQALGSAETGAVGTGSTGFGINSAAPSFGLDATIGASAFTPSELAQGLTNYGAESTSPFGVNTSTPTTEFGTFNPSTVSSPSIDASSLNQSEWLGGTGSLSEGTAGLTSEQLANATSASQVGSNASSGLGYLGGAESLPSGTAGITGVTSGTNWSDFSKSVGDLLGGNQPKNLANALYGGSVDLGGVNIPRSTQPAFSYTQQLPIQSGTSSSPTFLGQLGDMQTQQKLANLLKG